MKLFGNKRGKTKKASEQMPMVEYNEEMTGEIMESEPDIGKAEKQPKKLRITGLQKGLIILGSSVLLLVILVIIMWKNFSTPPDITPEPPITADSGDGDENPQGITATAKVTTSTLVTENPDTGELEELTIEVPVGRKQGYYTVLLVGTDKSDALTDTIMVASFDSVNGKLNIVSVPRDTISNGKWDVPKINSAYMVGGQGEDGMELLIAKLTDILGFQVDGYALIDLSAFKDVVDAIGGVMFDVPQDMYYYDPTQNLTINLQKGEQLLDGNKAEQLVRYRSGYAAKDLARVEVQQDFMKACAKQLLKVGSYSKVAKILSENIMTDLTLGNIAWFGERLLKISVDDIETMTLPGNSIMWSGLSYYALYGADVLDLVNEYLNPYEEDLTMDDINPLTVSGGTRVKSYMSSTKVSSQTSTTNYNTSTSSSSSSSSSAASTQTSAQPSASPEPVVNTDEVDGDTDTPEDTPSDDPEGGSSETTPEPETTGTSATPGVETRPEELPGGDQSNTTPASGTIAG